MRGKEDNPLNHERELVNNERLTTAPDLFTAGIAQELIIDGIFSGEIRLVMDDVVIYLQNSQIQKPTDQGLIKDSEKPDTGEIPSVKGSMTTSEAGKIGGVARWEKAKEFSRVCEHCGRTFVSKHPSARFCPGTDHRQLAYYRNKQGPNIRRSNTTST